MKFFLVYTSTLEQYLQFYQNTRKSEIIAIILILKRTIDLSPIFGSTRLLSLVLENDSTRGLHYQDTDA